MELVVELRGRLGNQLFLWASGLGLAAATGAELRFWDRVPEGGLDLPALVGSSYREVEPRALWKYGFVDRPPAPELLWRSLARWYGKARRRVDRSVRVTGAGEPGRFVPDLLENPGSLLVRDWLQSERYFAPIADEIVDRLRFPDGAPGLLDAVPRPAVAVSFRRGDYNALGAALGLDYYTRALDVVLARVEAAGALVVFADDAAFAELVTGWLGTRGVPVVNALTVASDAVGQLRAMSACDHFVIPNSSFAWWGAWLGERRGSGSVVVAPAEYAVDGDRVPSRWLTVPGGVAAGLV